MLSTCWGPSRRIVLTFALSFNRPMGPFERVSFVNGVDPGKIMRAIEAWLEISQS
ncbi:hypothetical protein JST97_03045 [bacterium]|nr:hypothetical protein [bacterium]